MRIAVPKETRPGERRVALVPESVTKLTGSGLEVVVEAGAGDRAGYSDDAYRGAGASIAPDRASALAGAQVVVTVRAPDPADVRGLDSGSTLIGLLQPLTSPELLRALADAGVTSFAMELVPRITRAQRMDALSSQATVAGYRAVLLGAVRGGRLFPMLMTAAGTIPPAKVLVIGTGVAGLQAIATARRLGAVVQGFDIRPAAKEQVESLGATWVGMEMKEAEGAGGYAQEVSDEAKQREHEHLAKLVAEADVVVTTAQIPGRPAPVLVTRDMVERMKPGSVIVDVAAESGGNCELTKPDEDVEQNGVTILGPTDLACVQAVHASQMYSRNLLALLQHLIKDGALDIDTSDEITAGCLVTHEGRIVHERARATTEAKS